VIIFSGVLVLCVCANFLGQCIDRMMGKFSVSSFHLNLPSCLFLLSLCKSVMFACVIPPLPLHCGVVSMHFRGCSLCNSVPLAASFSQLVFSPADILSLSIPPSSLVLFPQQPAQAQWSCLFP